MNQDFSTDEVYSIDTGSVTPAQVAEIFTKATGRSFNEKDIHYIADDGGLLHEDGTFDLFAFDAFILRVLGYDR